MVTSQFQVIMLNKFFSVGEVVYGESKKQELDFFPEKIKSFKFNCPCVKAYYQQSSNTIIVEFVGNEKVKVGKDYKKIIVLTVEYITGEIEQFDLLLIITRYL